MVANFAKFTYSEFMNLKTFKINLTSPKGYTLLEVTIALALISFTLAPISMMIHRNNSIIRARQEIMAMCLIEQEISKARCRSLNILPVQHRVINDIEWTITSDISGDKLKTVSMVAACNGRVRGQTVFYEYPEK
jgi:prepilin-type N-terminal cleavage/methylation domain-containing protein